jgi:nicotinate-nucleotide adenylyltransferase
MTAAGPRRIGILGGTFDPPHLGHLVAASEVHHRLQLDEVLFVPAGEPWQKTEAGDVPTPAHHRAAMVRLAIAGDDRFSMSTVDLDRAGPTYTADTLADLRRIYGEEAHFFLILGADALANLPTWNRLDEVASGCTLVGVTRPGHDLEPPGAPVGEVMTIELPGTSISATQCRERFRTNVPNKYLVTDSVIEYVREHALYGGAA